jgi:phosphosulfolactate phosphohydrolase-like enzyme
MSESEELERVLAAVADDVAGVALAIRGQGSRAMMLAGIELRDRYADDDVSWAGFVAAVSYANEHPAEDNHVAVAVVARAAMHARLIARLTIKDR